MTPSVNSRRLLREWYEDIARAGAMTPQAVGYRSARAWAGVQAALRTILPATGCHRILDVGCGHGVMLSSWARSTRVVGVDVAWHMLPLARQRGLLVVQGDATALPFRDASFDVVVSVEVLQHIDDADSFIAGLARQVRPGGRVLIGTANAASLIRRLANAAMRLGILSRLDPPDLPLPRTRPLRAVTDAGVRAGLVPEQLAVSYFPLQVGRCVERVGTTHALLVSNFLVAFRRPVL